MFLSTASPFLLSRMSVTLGDSRLCMIHRYNLFSEGLNTSCFCADEHYLLLSHKMMDNKAQNKFFYFDYRNKFLDFNPSFCTCKLRNTLHSVLSNVAVVFIFSIFLTLLHGKQYLEVIERKVKKLGAPPFFPKEQKFWKLKFLNFFQVL